MQPQARGTDGESATAPAEAERVAYDEWVATLNGYPRRFSTDVGERALIYYASERGDAHPFLGGYVIRDLADGRQVKRELFDGDWPPVSQKPCASWYGAGCDYPGTVALDTESLPAGTYSVVLHDFLGHESRPIYFNLRPPPTAEDLPAVVMLYPSFTYAAYSRFGGGSLYGPPVEEGRWEASLRRPIPYNGSLNDAYNSPESMGCFARRFRVLGIPVLPISSLDLHEHPEYLANARVLLIGPHDEYWSRAIADAVHDFLGRGGHVAILGGGVQSQQVEVLPTGIRLDRRRRREGADNDDRPVTGRFRGRRIGLPPERHFGLASRHGGRPATQMTIEDALRLGLACDLLEQAYGVVISDAGHPIFAGTGLTDGDVYGATLGVHWRSTDGIPLTLDGEVDRERAPHAAPDIRVLAHAIPYRRRVQPGANPRVGVIAETRHPGGGRVLHFGSYGWFRSVCSGDEAGVRIFDNAIRYLLELETPGPTQP